MDDDPATWNNPFGVVDDVQGEEPDLQEASPPRFAPEGEAGPVGAPPEKLAPAAPKNTKTSGCSS